MKFVIQVVCYGCCSLLLLVALTTFWTENNETTKRVVRKFQFGASPSFRNSSGYQLQFADVSTPPTMKEIYRRISMENKGDVEVDELERRVLETQEKRHERLNKFCVKFRNSFPTPNWTKSADQMYINDRRQYIYCKIPKVASTNWKRVLLMLTGHMTVNNPTDLTKRQAVYNSSFSDKYLRRMISFPQGKMLEKLNDDNYFKFMFVREPFERLVSTYRAKLARPDYMQQPYGSKIIAKYRVNASKSTIKAGNDTTFDEFVRYLLDPATQANGKVLDQHWGKYHELCHPCHVRYDFIGKFETLAEDAAFVIKQIGGRTRFPDFDPDYKGLLQSKEFVETMKRNISEQQFIELKTMYSLDYKLFGYL